MAVTFPNRNTKFSLEDFYQVEVDDFRHGHFLFLSATKVKIRTDAVLFQDVESVDEYGWIVSTYSYTVHYYEKILLCNFKAIPWHNHYKIRGRLASLNGCDGYAIENTTEEFIEWMKTEPIEVNQ
jgi:hypothetical protein